MDWVGGRQKMLEEEGETGDPRILESVMLLAWSVSTDPLQATVRAEKEEEGVSSPHHALMRCGTAAAGQGAVGWALSLSLCAVMHHFELSK